MTDDMMPIQMPCRGPPLDCPNTLAFPCVVFNTTGCDGLTPEGLFKRGRFELQHPLCHTKYKLNSTEDTLERDPILYFYSKYARGPHAIQTLEC